MDLFQSRRWRFALALLDELLGRHGVEAGWTRIKGITAGIFCKNGCAGILASGNLT